MWLKRKKINPKVMHAKKKKDKSEKPDVKCKWEKLYSDGQETGQATKHHCSEEKKSVKSSMEHTDAKEDMKPETSIGVLAVMEFRSISTGK